MNEQVRWYGDAGVRVFAACGDSRLRSWDTRVSALRDDRGDALQVGRTLSLSLAALPPA